MRNLVVARSNFQFVSTLGSLGPQLGVLVQFNHLAHDRIRTAVQVRVVVVLLGAVAALLQDPKLLAWAQVTLEARVILTDHSLDWVVVAITDVVSALRNASGPPNVVGNEGLAVGAQPFQDFGVEAAIFVCAVLPWRLLALLVVDVLEVVVEEVAAGDELASLPLSNVTSL